MLRTEREENVVSGKAQFLLKERGFATLLHDRINIDNDTAWPISEKLQQRSIFRMCHCRKMNLTETFSISDTDMFLGS